MSMIWYIHIYELLYSCLWVAIFKSMSCYIHVYDLVYSCLWAAMSMSMIVVMVKCWLGTRLLPSRRATLRILYMMLKGSSAKSLLLNRWVMKPRDIHSKYGMRLFTWNFGLIWCEIFYRCNSMQSIPSNAPHAHSVVVETKVYLNFDWLYERLIISYCILSELTRIC